MCSWSDPTQFKVGLYLKLKRGSPRAIPRTTLWGLDEIAPRKSAGARLLSANRCVDNRKKSATPEGTGEQKENTWQSERHEARFTSGGFPEKWKHETKNVGGKPGRRETIRRPKASRLFIKSDTYVPNGSACRARPSQLDPARRLGIQSHFIFICPFFFRL